MSYQDDIKQMKEHIAKDGHITSTNGISLTEVEYHDNLAIDFRGTGNNGKFVLAWEESNWGSTLLAVKKHP